MQRVNGAKAEQYTKLSRYGAKLLKIIEKPQSSFGEMKVFFKGFYVYLKPLKDSFSYGYRPVVGFDGCFLKELYDDQVLLAVGIDPNNCIYPIAYTVVLNENRESWTWFMELLRDDLEIWNS